MHAPFTPFTVTFCEIIANPATSQDDLKLLADFVAALKSLSHISEGVAKLYRLCDVFQKVADLYVQAKAQEADSGRPNGDNELPIQGSLQPAITDIDDYLSAIGFAPPPQNNEHDLSAQPLGDMSFDANYLNDWYSGNSSLMGMLEQDMFFPNGSNFDYGPIP